MMTSFENRREFFLNALFLMISLEFELLKMMNEIQSNLKCLGLLEPYFWKKGEACAVRGSDTLWHRGKVTEVVGGTVRVSPTCFVPPLRLNVVCKLGGLWNLNTYICEKTVLMRSFLKEGQSDALHICDENSLFKYIY